MKTINKLTTLNKVVKEMSTQSLFTLGGTFMDKELREIFKKAKMKYCSGKYAPTIKNKEQDVLDECIVWYESRSDEHGPYVVMYCLNDNIIEKELYDERAEILAMINASLKDDEFDDLFTATNMMVIEFKDLIEEVEDLDEF